MSPSFLTLNVFSGYKIMGTFRSRNGFITERGSFGVSESVAVLEDGGFWSQIENPYRITSSRD